MLFDTPSPGNKITIRDVAKQAGVSISSVSRALSNHPHVSETLRARVREATISLNYQPDFLAHSLRSGSTRSVGFVVGTISNPIMADISASLGKVLASHGYAMMLISSQNEPELDDIYLQFLAHRQVSGIVISTAADGEMQVGGLIQRLGIPTVMLDRQRLPSDHVSAVQSDHRTGMQEATAHLLGQGHRRIAIIGGQEYFDPARERLMGFRVAMQEAGIAIDPSLERSVGMSKLVGYTETLSLMGLPNPPTALIAGGNLILTGVLQALHERKVVVGRDLALIGCDDTELTQLHSPAISVIARDLSLMGETAANLLLDTIQNGDGTTVVLPTHLKVRESSLS